ncbi:MAG: alkaline phosphatase family protein [Phycisphaerales bacterium]
MASPVALINVVGLSGGLIGEHTPRLAQLAARGCAHPLRPILPAVTCSAQATMLTGLTPREHGIVGNGWFDRTLNEVHFWKQSNALVGGEKIWEAVRRRDPKATTANLFWWFNMYSTADVAVTPRPMYPADGRKLPDVWTHPPALRSELQAKLGTFPLFRFWGPAASIESSRWIAEAAIEVHRRHRPALSLVYLPHLDYPLQKLGPAHPAIPAELRAVDDLVGRLVDHFEGEGVRALVVSEYGIETVDRAAWPNRMLRDAGFLAVRDERGREQLDAGASRAFVVVDHQVAHVYVRDANDLAPVRQRCAALEGVADVLDRTAQGAVGLDHPRAGELVLVAKPDWWFAYGWWLDDARAPDYARTVDIHRKPGYDPLELVLDPALRFPRGRIAWTLLKRRLGFRSLLEVIPLDASLIHGSHGRIPERESHWPVLIAPRRHGAGLGLADVKSIVLREMFDVAG